MKSVINTKKKASLCAKHLQDVDAVQRVRKQTDTAHLSPVEQITFYKAQIDKRMK